jgi:hypothetical protein
VLDDVSLIALEAYDRVKVKRNIASAVHVQVIPHTMFFPPLVLCVRLQRWWQQCQPYLITLCICGMLLLVTIYYISLLVFVWNTDFHFYIVGIQLLDIHQHRYVMWYTHRSNTEWYCFQAYMLKMLVEALGSVIVKQIRLVVK